MNIEKLAKHLKEFTLDEINMIAECDVENELKQLLNSHNIVFQHGVYKYVEQREKTFELCAKPKKKLSEKIFLDEIATEYISSRNLTKDTLKGYKALLKYNILPYFNNIFISDITFEKINEFMLFMKATYRPKTASNGVTLLGSLLKFAFDEGYIDNNPYYGVKNAKCK